MTFAFRHEIADVLIKFAGSKYVNNFFSIIE